MAPKRKTGGLRKPIEVDFQCPDNDAWYNVRLHKEKEGALRVMYREFLECGDDRYTIDQFDTHEQLDELIRRFRMPSKQLQDSECRKVSQGMLVLVCHTFEDDELRFYDAVVDSVSFSKHKKPYQGEGEGICTCKFVVTWKQGPLKGNKSTVSTADICLMASSPVADPIFLDFVERAKISLQQKGISKSNPTSSSVSPNLSHHNEEPTPPKKARTSESNCTGDTSNGSFFFWVDNIDTDIVASNIVEFLEREISVSPQVTVLPSVLYESRCSASIFVKSESDALKMGMLFSEAQSIIVSSKGCPWIITDRLCGKTKGQMPTVEMNKIDGCKEESSGIRVVRPGSKEHEHAKKVLNLHKEYDQHIQGLQRHFACEETVLCNSVSNKSNSNLMVIDDDD